MNLEIFPDYCSTGMWHTETRASVDEVEIDPTASDAIAQALFAGLRQWHWMWEFMITEHKLSDTAVEVWASDGAVLTAALNKHYNGVHTFVYRDDLLEV